MIKYKKSLRGLFSNTKFLIAFSVVLAFVFWIVVALEFSQDHTEVIKDVPITINLENSVPSSHGLQYFGNADYKLNVTVTGKRYEVGGNSLSADDFEATAQTASVDSAGNHFLQVSVIAKDDNADYEITEVSAEYIEVYFDRYKEKKFILAPEINSTLDSITEEGYLFDEDKDVIINGVSKEVVISGPEREVERISGVRANVNIEQKLTATQTFNAEVGLLYSSEAPKYVQINGQDTLEVPVTIKVYKEEVLPVVVSFKNSPSQYLQTSPAYSCYPSNVKVAVLKRHDKTSVNQIELGDIDFNTISIDNTSFELNESNLKNADQIKFLENTQAFSVNVNLPNINTQTYTIDSSNITIKGADGNTPLLVTVQNDGKVDVSGNLNDLLLMSNSNLKGTVDLKNQAVPSEGLTVPIKIELDSLPNCWVTGEYYALVKPR